MSWFAQSIANTLKPDNNEEEYPLKHQQQVSGENSPHSHSPTRGVKEDLSEITKTLTRQFWDVASLISPPIPAGRSSEQEAIDGVRRDFAEIGGRFRSGVLKVSEITKLASEFLQVDSDDEDDDYDSSDDDGVTDEVVAFASDLALHPETWMDFPLPEDEDFDLSDAQREHALAVERSAPRLRALRIELCPGYMSESSFWKIYFVLLHPRLGRDAADILSTPKIMKARALLTHDSKTLSCSENMSDSKSPSLPLEVSVVETVKHPIKSDDIQIVDKSVIQEESHEGKDEDDWLKQECSEIVTNRVAITIENNENVSFSDLEDDDDDDHGNIPILYKKATYASDSSTKDSDSLDQVSFHNSETKESNDWLDVEIDMA